MENKKKMVRHLVVIYLMYFIALLAGFATNFVTEFSRGWHEAQEDVQHYSYIVSAPLNNSTSNIQIEGLDEKVNASIERLQLKVNSDQEATIGNAFKTIANSWIVYLTIVIIAVASISIFVLFALIINSLRKSVRDEHPIPHSNITRTRWIGVLFLLIEGSNFIAELIHHQEATALLQGTGMEVLQTLPLNYWNIIIGILFLFMAEVFAIGSKLSEEQKLTI